MPRGGKRARRARILKRENARRRAQMERYYSVREWARETEQRAFRVSMDPHASEIEKREAWEQARDAGMWRIDVHRWAYAHVDPAPPCPTWVPKERGGVRG